MVEQLRVALAHDWLTGMRGGEKVLEILARMFPQAPIYTLVHKPGSVSNAIASHPIRTSPLQNLPFGVSRYRHFLPLYPSLADRVKIEPVDLVLSVSSCVAKGFIPPAGAHVASYVLTPMRYIYDRYEDYFSPGRAGLATRVAMRMIRGRLQRWDIANTDRIHDLAGISTFIVDRIRTIYNRPANLIYPPVNVDRFAGVKSSPSDYYLIVSALAPYKNVDVAVEAFRKLDRKLIVAGDGPMRRALARNCPPNVELLGWVADAEIPKLVANCRAFLFPNVEDFGIAPVEATAAGRPVIALGEGGALDTVRDYDRWRQGALVGERSLGPTGLFFPTPTPEALAEAILRFEQIEDQFDPRDCQRWARRFDQSRFESEMRAWVDTITQRRQEQRRAA